MTPAAPRGLAAAAAAASRATGRRAAADITGRVACVSGAGHGIGRGLAMALARQGCRLALSDVSEQRLAETCSLLPAATRVEATVVDVSDRSAVHRWADATSVLFGGVDIVINNAGITHFGSVAGTRYEDYERVIGVNLMGAIHGTKAFLPHLFDSDDAHLVNIASIFGVIAVPSQSAYNVSKFAVRGFTEALAEEMAMLGTGVQVHLVLPGGVRTGIARDSTSGETHGLIDVDRTRNGFHTIARTTPQQAGELIVRGVRRGDRRILVGSDAVALDVMARLLPVRYQSLVVRALRGR